jgi:hypothetical protein
MGPPHGGPIILLGTTMIARKRRRSACWAVVLALLYPRWPAHAQERGFPFGSELMLDAAPLYGSKRMPMIEIEDNGTASIDLWCASVRGEATVGDASITIVAEPPTGAQCTPERQSGDQDLLAALTQVTGWRRDGDLVEFSGPTTLRFRLLTN